MDPSRNPAVLSLLDVYESKTAAATSYLTLVTEQGEIHAIRHDAENAHSAVLWVCGAGGGLDGPAGGVYERLARQLVPEHVASLRLDYRLPGQFLPCVLDVLLGIAHLEGLDFHRIVLVGHSFGGAVAIHTGALSQSVIAVAALSSQLYGADIVDELCPRRLLLVHGELDEVNPHSCSDTLYERAKEPKQLLKYRMCAHDLDACRDDLDRDLYEWLLEVTSSDLPDGEDCGDRLRSR